MEIVYVNDPMVHISCKYREGFFTITGRKFLQFLLYTMSHIVCVNIVYPSELFKFICTADIVQFCASSWSYYGVSKKAHTGVCN